MLYTATYNWEKYNAVVVGTIFLWLIIAKAARHNHHRRFPKRFQDQMPQKRNLGILTDIPRKLDLV